MIVKKWCYTYSWGDQLLHHWEPLILSSLIVFGFLKSHFKNVCRELQVKLAGEGYQIVGKFFIFLTYLKAKSRKNGPHGKNYWQEDYLRLPYFCSFLSNIIYNPFMPIPSPTGVSLPCNLPFVICSFMLLALWMGCCIASCPEMWKCPETWSTLVGFISVIKHWHEELDNLIIHLWLKVVSSGSSAVNDPLLHFSFML